MLIIKPDYYDEFNCIADKCDETCCIGWQIMIDDESLEKYKNVPGELGNRLKTEVDYEECCFKQNGRECAFLKSDGLCELQATYGEDMLCNTCKKYPRHTEEYEDVRELSLSLSCPAAADIMLSQKEQWTFITEENDEFDDDFDEFDFLLYDKLVIARDVIFKLIQARNISLLTRMKMLVQLADEMQELHNDDKLGEVDGMLVKWEEKLELEEAEILKGIENSELDNYSKTKDRFSILYELEMLNPDWLRILDNTWNKYYDDNQGTDSLYEGLSNEIENALENILMFFVYTYFCGAVYDDMIFSKIALSVYSTRWIYEIACANSFAQDKILNLRKAAVKYAREVEHSDLNINALEDAFFED